MLKTCSTSSETNLAFNNIYHVQTLEWKFCEPPRFHYGNSGDMYLEYSYSDLVLIAFDQVDEDLVIVFFSSRLIVTEK